MSHNFATVREFSEARGFVPINLDNPVLTVRSGRYTDATGEVSFYRNFDEELVVNPWNEDGRSVTFGRQDLFALREFLAEFPEESFERPADPVEKQPEPRWTDGDKILEVRPGSKNTWLYERIDGRWETTKVTGTAVKSLTLQSDDELSGYVDAKVTGGDTFVVLRQQSEGIDL